MDTATVRQEEVFGTDHGLIHEAVITGRKVGAGREFWSALAHDEDLFRRVVGIVLPTPTGSTTPEEAARTMGSNFHGPEEVAKHFGFKFSAKQGRALQVVPFSTGVLEECKATHILVASAAMSIMDVHVRATSAFYSRQDPWYASERFATTKVKVAWHLIRSDPMPGSTSKTWSEQQAMVPNDSLVPQAGEMVQAIILHYLVTGERLFPNIYVRTDDVSRDGGRVVVGYFDADGLSVYYWVDGPGGRVGVASARKFS